MSFLDAILAPSILPLTVLLALCTAYWLVVVLGGLSADALDVDIPAGSSGGGGTSEVATGTHASVAQAGIATTVLRFLNLGEVPLMVVLTVLVFATWAMSLLLHPLTAGWTPVAQFAALLPMLVVAAVLSKLATWPVKRLFGAMREEERAAQHLELIGKVCRVISAHVTPSVGQAEFETSGAPVLLNVRTRDADALSRGDEAVIVGQDERTGIYFVRGLQI